MVAFPQPSTLTHSKLSAAISRAMVFVTSMVFLAFHMIFAEEKHVGYPCPTADVTIGKFKAIPFHYLLAEKVTSSVVNDELECTFLCIGELKCYSFNIAVYPDSEGLYLCELLATDKYRETEKFSVNSTFHYYFPRVSSIFCRIWMFYLHFWISFIVL